MKRVLFIISLFTMSFSFSQENEVKGVVTYYHNQYVGTKPDVGSEIIIVKNIDNDTIDKKLENYKYQLLKYGMDLKLSKYSSKSRESLEESEFLLKEYEKIKDERIKDIRKNSLVTLTVDGSGNYSYSLPKGTYEVVCLSKNRRKKIDYKFIKVSENITVVDFDFGPI